VAILCLAPAVADAQAVSIYVDGKRRDGRFPPQLRNGRTLMFLRDTFDAIDAAVIWYSGERRIKAWLAEDEIELWIGNPNAKVNGKTVTLDQPPIIDEATNSTLVPLRFIGEAVGAGVKYTNSGNRVDIDTAQIPYMTEKAPFAVGDTVEILLYPKDIWVKAKVTRVFEQARGLDSYGVEYQEPPPNARVMSPTLRRTYIRKVRG
jgi:hypothetical protein